MPAVHSTLSSGSSPDVPKWAWLAALGGTLALGGVAYYVLYGGGERGGAKAKKKAKKKAEAAAEAAAAAAPTSTTTVTIEDDNEDDVVRDLLCVLFSCSYCLVSLYNES